MRGIEYEPILLSNNKNITFKSEVSFLRIYIDQMLRFKEHTEYVRQNTIKRLDLLKCLSNFNRGADRETLLRICKAVIRSKIDYGAQIYAAASNHILKN